MSVIAPNGQIRLLSEVPIDDMYENTLYFNNKTEQLSYFINLSPIHIMNNCTRVRDGVIRVDGLADNLLHANYMMFQNTNFSNKWFYAFVENVEYINNETTEITYVIDEVQTWLYEDNVSLKQCIVEREHTSTDALFEHLLNENIEVGEYVNNFYNVGTDVYYFERYTALLFLTVTSAGTTYGTPAPGPWQGNLNGLAVLKYDVQDTNGDWLTYDPTITDPEQMNELEKLIYIIDGLVSTQQAESIVGLTLVPIDFINTSDDGKKAKQISLGFHNYSVGHTLDGYTPKNNKLYNSPYCMLQVGLTDGQSNYLQPEYLPKSACEVEILPNISPISSLAIVVKNYKGKERNYETILSYSQFAQCAMAIDGYKAWVASGGNVHTSLTVGQGISSVLTGTATALSGLGTSTQYKGFDLVDTEKPNVFRAQHHYKTALTGVKGTALGLGGALTGGGAYSIANALYDSSLAKHLPNGLRGDINTQSLTATMQLGIITRHMTITKDVARSIDDYFTMFGYKVNKLKVPELKNRKEFTYVKTMGCKIVGDIPSSSLTNLMSIFNAGIRFWVNPSKVGDYTVDNGTL